MKVPALAARAPEGPTQAVRPVAVHALVSALPESLAAPVAARLAQALDGGIGLLACENTMQNTKITKSDMYGGIGYVQAGVTHLMKRQKEGWAYIRP